MTRAADLGAEPQMYLTCETVLATGHRRHVAFHSARFVSVADQSQRATAHVACQRRQLPMSHVSAGTSGGGATSCSRTSVQDFLFVGPPSLLVYHSHSMVPGGFEVMSYTTRLTAATRLQMRADTSLKCSGLNPYLR